MVLNQVQHQGLLRFGSTTKLLAKRVLKYYRISKCMAAKLEAIADAQMHGIGQMFPALLQMQS